MTSGKSCCIRSLRCFSMLEVFYFGNSDQQSLHLSYVDAGFECRVCPSYDTLQLLGAGCLCAFLFFTKYSTICSLPIIDRCNTSLMTTYKYSP